MKQPKVPICIIVLILQGFLAWSLRYGVPGPKLEHFFSCVGEFFESEKFAKMRFSAIPALVCGCKTETTTKKAFCARCTVCMQGIRSPDLQRRRTTTVSVIFTKESQSSNHRNSKFKTAAAQHIFHRSTQD